jgi:ABC-type multidrug transport system fused ATPase/permease subunit
MDRNSELKKDLIAFARNGARNDYCSSNKNQISSNDAEKRWTKAQHKSWTGIFIALTSLIVILGSAYLLGANKDIMIGLTFAVKVFWLIYAVCTGSEHKNAFMALQKTKGISEEDAKRIYNRKYSD